MSQVQGSNGMDASEIYNLIECVNCGAKLSPVDQTGSRHCHFCDTTYQAPPPAPPQPPPAMQAPPNLGGWSAVNPGTGQPQTMGVTYVAPQTSRGCGAGVLIFVLILVASIGIPLFFVLKESNLSSIFADKPDGNVAVAPASLNGGKTMFTLVHKLVDTSTKYSVVRLDEGNSKPVWTSAELTATNITNAPIITDGTNVYIPDGERLVALKASDGTLAWQAALSDVVSPSCDNCMFVNGSLLVVETNDANLHAFSLKSGESAWTRKNGDTRAYAAPFGDKTLILDRDPAFNGYVALLNADGSEATKIEPSCKGSKDFGAERFDSDANVILQTGDNAVILGWGSPYPCWSRIDFTTGQPTWTTFLENSSYPVGRDDTFVVTQGSKAAIVGGKYIAALNLETGEYTPVNEIDDVKMYPLGMRENTLILQIATQRGTPKHSINAVDMTSGTGVWNIDLGTAAPSQGPDASNTFVSTNSARFASGLDGDTFRTLVFAEAGRQLSTYTVTVSSGKQTKSSVASGVDELLPNFDVVGWRGSTAIISFRSGGLMVFDTATNAITYRYP